MATFTRISTFTTSGPDSGDATSGNIAIDSSGNLLVEGDSGVYEVAYSGGGYASTPTLLVGFDASDGNLLTGGLISDASGNLYGVGAYGGTNNDGTIFEIAKTADGYASAPTVLTNFDDTDDAHPVSKLVMDSAGDLFGTTSNGSAPNNQGIVFELAKTSDGYAAAPITLAQLSGQGGISPLAMDADGNLFGTTATGGVNGDGMVFEIAKTADGYASAKTLVSLGSADGNPGPGLAIDAAGNLFGMTNGANGTGEIFEIAKTADGYAATATVLASFPHENNHGGTLLIDGAGDLFATRLPSGGAFGGNFYELPKTDGIYASAPTLLTSLNDASPLPGLTSDAAGNLFGASNGGAPLQNSPPVGDVFEVTGTGFVPVTASTGETIGADDTAGQHLTGTAKDDTFYAGHNSVVMTGGDGADHFIFQYEPWNAGSITDFTPGTDQIDVSALLSAAHYAGSDPVADGLLSFQSDGQNNTQVLFHDPANAWPSLVTTLDGVAPSSIMPADYGYGSSSGGGGGGGGGTTGETLTADDSAGQHLTGTPYDDTFFAGHNSVVMTGNGGADTFVFQYEPWNAGSITDFTPGNDKLDLSALLSAAGYTGSDPVADGYVAFQSDGNGDTQVYFNPHDPSQQWPTLITTLDNVSPSTLTAANTLGTAGSSSGGGGGSTNGETLTANDTAGQQLTGTPNDDTFFAGHNSVVMTGDGGADQFVFQYLPWNAGSITDFNTADDVLNLKGIFASIGYSGHDPVADGYLVFQSDGQGDTHVIVNPQGPGTQIPITVTTLDHVDPSMIHSGDYLFA